MSGGGGNTTTTTKSDPWSGQQPYLQQVMSSAQNLYQNNAPQYYPGQTVAQFNPFQTGAQQMTASLAGQPTASGAAQGNLSQTLNGDFLNSNPYLDQMANAANNSTIRQYQSAVAPGISSNFEANGRYGSGAMANAQSQAQQDLATQLGNTNASIYGNNYENERQNQIRAAALAPGVDAGIYTPAQMLSGVGGQVQNQEQANIQGDINRFNYNQNLPWDQLARYQQMIQGNYGGSSQTTQPYYQNQAAGALGGAASGAMLGSTFGPWGTAIGAGVGGLTGLLSSKDVKTDKAPISHEETLQKVEGLPVENWRYLPGVADGGQHIGPYAQDFAAAFGGNPHMISPVDAHGVALSAIKGLADRVGLLSQKLDQVKG